MWSVEPFLGPDNKFMTGKKKAAEPNGFALFSDSLGTFIGKLTHFSVLVRDENVNDVKHFPVKKCA